MKKTVLMRTACLLFALFMVLNVGTPVAAFLVAVTVAEPRPERILTAEGEDWSVDVTVYPDEDWPDSVLVRAEEVDDPLPYLERTGTAKEKTEFFRFFNLGLYAGGEEIQPEGRTVRVEIAIPELESADAAIQVVHFPDPAEQTPALEMDAFEGKENLTAAEIGALEIIDADPSPAEFTGEDNAEGDITDSDTADEDAVDEDSADETVIAEDIADEDAPDEDRVEEDVIDEAAADEELADEDIPEQGEPAVEEIEYELVERDGKTAVSFAADGFSVYGVIGTTIEKTVLASDGNSYRITVSYADDAGIPENADLAVEEITEDSGLPGRSYRDYVEGTESALGLESGSADYIRLFDIKIVERDRPDVKLQPAEGSTVDVRIELADAQDGKNLNIVHFAEGEETPDVIDNAEVTAAEFNGRVVKFRTDGFSVYAIVGGDDSTPETKSIKYVFHYSDRSPYTFANINGDKTDTQYVKDGETLFYIGTPIDDPNREGKEFWGWYAGTINGDVIEWGEEIEFETPISVSETTTVNVYARYEQTYYVTYYDENGNVYSVVKHANGDSIRLDVTGTETVYTASYAQKAFLGWSTTAGTTDEIAEGTTLTVTGNVSLYPAINNVKWINFNAGETGNGASYTPPVYVLGSTVTSDKKPDDPTRRGYAFQGWYKDEAFTQEFKWDGTETLADDITLYAKWIEADTIYTVVIWKQNLDGTGYDYVESRTVDALTGSTAATSTTDTGRDYTGFSYVASKSDTTATVLANGTTTLNVRYDRNPYALTFEVPGGGYIYTPSANGTWGYIDGEYVQLDVQSNTSYVYSMPSYVETTSSKTSGELCICGMACTWNAKPPVSARRHLYD